MARECGFISGAERALNSRVPLLCSVGRIMTARKNRPGRPPASSRVAIEEIALVLFAEEGYGGTTIESLAAAAGISKTSIFRYFRSKSDIVWGVFDKHIDRLRATLESSDPDVPTMTAVRSAVVTALLADTDQYGLWLRRFRLFDTSPGLREGALARWSAWAMVIAEFVGGRVGSNPAEMIPAAAGAAVQAAVLAELRSWIHESAPPADLIDRLEGDLVALCDALEGWLDTKG
jgi:AcrR family transcriptional regulator